MDFEQPSLPDPADQLSPTRRSFYIKFIYGAMTAIGAALAIPAGIYLLFPPKAHKEGEWVDAADLSRIPVGTPEEVSFQRTRVDGWKVTSEKATGCAYHWDDQSHNFLCPCHTSAFSVDGKVLSGPAPRPLDRYMVKIQGNKLQIGPLEEHE